jgi:hypothetical protein
MALNRRTRLGIAVAIAVLAGLTSGVAGALVLVLAWLLIVWGQAPERTVCRAAMTSLRHWPG